MAEDTSQEKDTPPSHLDEGAQGRKDLIRALVVCIAAVVVIRSFIFEPFKIPSSSMVPSLRIGDYIFVSKFDFGLSIPFTKIELIRWSAPKRGDVIVFLYPKDESLHYVKRVVGVPGDKLEFKGRKLFINGLELKEEAVTDPAILKTLADGREDDGEIFRETLGDRVHWVRFLPRPEAGFSEATQTEVVPPDRFFVVGDNRDQSYDSRSWGYVARENIKGRARIIWLSLDQGPEWLSLQQVRWSRTGMLVK